MEHITGYEKKIIQRAFYTKIIPMPGRSLMPGDYIHELGIVSGEIERTTVLGIDGVALRRQPRPEGYVLFLQGPAL